MCIGSLGLLLGKIVGLGNPLIYDSNPVYGYRPLPNQERSRFWGARIKINNLGLRAEEQWVEDTSDKILFLGDSVTYGGSYIDNKELFSYLAVEGLGNFKSGNAGVNAWGVENIYGLIVESEFLPAKVYVIVLPEGDFYRGLTRMQGLPLYNVTPKFALLELWYYFCYKQNNARYREWRYFASEDETRYVVEKAVKKLEKIDAFLKKRGCKYLLFITPSRKQVLDDIGKDSLIYDLLIKYNLDAIYILDKLNGFHLSNKEKCELFYDSVHLSRKGHETWAKVIGAELEKIVHS